MTTQEVATQLVKLCREGKFEQVYQELFSPEIESAEPESGSWRTVKGMDGIAKKAQQWQDMVDEVIYTEVSDPIVAADHFACTMKTKVKFKGMPNIIDMDEVCVYRVENGKVMLEQFFYTPLPELVS